MPKLKPGTPEITGKSGQVQMQRRRRVAHYIRVSSDDQDGETQRLALEQVSANFGDEVVAVFSESASSWIKNAKLPQRQRMLELARTGAVEAIRVRDTYRIGRSAMEVYRLLEQLQSYGVSVLPLLGVEMNLETAQGRFVAMVMAAAAEMDSSLKSEIIKQKLAQRKAKGLPVGRQAGVQPKVDKHYKQVVALIREGVGYAKISRRLELNFRTVKKIEAQALERGDLIRGERPLPL